MKRPGRRSAPWLQTGNTSAARSRGFPLPSVLGIRVDLGLRVGGFVDVLLLPRDPQRWPQLGSRTDFVIWSMDDKPQIRLRPVDPAFLRADSDGWFHRDESRKDA